MLIIEGASSYMFGRPVKDWRDKTILTTPKESIKEVRYQYGDTTFNITFSDSAWFIGKDKAQQSVVEGIVSSLSNTVSPKVTAMITYAGTQLRFSFDKILNKYYVQSSNSPQWFVLEQWKANQVLKRKREIVETNKK